MRKFLITNDDGIDADGIKRLAQAAAKLGEVWVVAPENQRSATSHSITLRTYVDVHTVDFGVEGVHAYSCSGTPADCVRVGALNIVPDGPDVVLSGINYGYNVASDIQYSATAGAAFEAAFQGIHAIALSEGCNSHETTDAYLDELLPELLDMPLGEDEIINVNFPDCKLSDCQGIAYDRQVSKSAFFSDSYNETPLDDGGTRFMVHGDYTGYCEEDTDFRAVITNYVSVGIATNIN